MKLILFLFITNPLWASQNTESVSVHEGTAPTPTLDANGSLWVVFNRGNHVWVSSRNQDGAFTSPVKVNQEPHSLSASGEDRPKIQIDAKGRIFVIYTRDREKLYSGDLMFSRSLDGGRSFETPQKLNDDQEQTAHAFADMGLNSQGHIYIAWIDGRDKEKAQKQEKEFKGSSIYATWSKDGGETFSPNKQWARDVCECCRLSLTFNASGLPILAWRHIFGDNIRDIAIGALNQQGEFTYQRGSFDQWKINGCPHQGPATSVDDTGELHLAWYTVNDDTALLRYNRFNASGKSQSKPIDLSNSVMNPTLLSQGNAIWVAWQSPDETTQLMLRTSKDRGNTWSEPTQIASSEGRTDHPHLLRHHNRVILTWKAPSKFHVFELSPANIARPDE